jgi:hypothetical protein
MKKINEKLVEDLIVYTCHQFADRDDMPELHLVRILYLVDWFYALEHETSLSGVAWTAYNHEPMGQEILQFANASDNKKLHVDFNNKSTNKIIIRTTQLRIPTLDPQVKKIVDFVLEKYKNFKNENEFETFLHATLPLQRKYGGLNLIQEAKKHKEREQTTLANVTQALKQTADKYIAEIINRIQSLNEKNKYVQQ